jgi:hypothetical protein
MACNTGNPAACGRIATSPYSVANLYRTWGFRRLRNVYRCAQHGGRQEHVRLGIRRSVIIVLSEHRGNLEMYMLVPNGFQAGPTTVSAIVGLF